MITPAEHPDMSRTTGCLLGACAWLAFAAIARPASAQEPAEPEDAVPARALGRVNVAPEGADLGDNIEQWVFGNRGAAKVRERFQAALTQDINRFDQKYSLTPAQKKKLELAGRQDMKRFFDRVEDAKSEYRRTNGDWNQVGNRIFELQGITNQPHTELFGDGSMLAKTLKKTLTPEQVARHETAAYRVRVEWAIGILHSRLVLNPEQRRRLVTLVVDETPPLKRYGSFDYDAIMLQMSRLPREKLRTALDEAQCRNLALRFEQARRMESILVSEGYISRSAPSAGTAAGEPKSHHEEVLR
jgi:hypothetical protein